MPETKDGGWMLDDSELNEPVYKKTNVRPKKPQVDERVRTIMDKVQNRAGAKFEMGDLVVEAETFAAINQAALYESVLSHMRAEWGEAVPSIKTANDAALVNKGELYTDYTDPDTGRPVTIMTDAGRTRTVVAFND